LREARVRIVVLTTSFPRSDEDPSGHFVRAAALRAAAHGDEVHVITPGGSPFAPPARRGALWVHDAGGGSLFAWPGAIARLRERPVRLGGAGVFAAGATARLRALERVGPIDRVVAHWMVPCGFPLALACRAPLDVVAHGADVRLLLGAPRVARERVLAALLARGGRFTFAARALLDGLVASVGPALGEQLAARAHVEPPAIDVPNVAARAGALRASLGLVEGEVVAVVVCRLVATKRVELAVDAVDEASRAGLRVRLVVVGDGPEHGPLAARAGGRAVTFVGAVPRREALAWIAAANVLLHPSGVEAAPTVIREARALAVPVVACDAGDVAAWARDDADITVAEPTPEALADALAHAVAHARAHGLAHTSAFGR
jgi:glycosyltransferase involved in cell wall biosynthesis